MNSPIRLACTKDAERILDIYRHFVDSTPISFETVAPNVEEMRTRMTQVLDRFPWLVWDDGKLKGYAYATPHRSRSAYQWSVDVTVYLGPDCRRQGIGRKLYEQLFTQLRSQNVVNAHAGITLPNEASVGFHESLGFEQIALYPRVGWKLGRWHDVGWWRLCLDPSGDPPRTIMPYAPGLPGAR